MSECGNFADAEARREWLRYEMGPPDFDADDASQDDQIDPTACGPVPPVLAEVIAERRTKEGR